MKNPDDEDIPPEVGFNDGVRGRHYASKNAALHFPPEPVVLDEGLQGALARIAVNKGVILDRLVNEMLKRDLESGTAETR